MDNKKIVREGYNKNAEKCLESRLEVMSGLGFVPEFVSLLKENSKVLDIGCGAGLPETKYLSERFEVIGIDISEKQIELAKQNVPKGTFYRKDMTELEFPDNYFGGIVALYSIIHVPRAEHADLFKNLHRMLKPDGIALLCLHSTDDEKYINDDFFGSEMHWSGFDADTNLKILKKIGFEKIWSKIIDDILGQEGKHLFVMLKKPHG